MSPPLSFQSIIMTLEKFWADRGCLIWQPYYAQVGAGTMNPATFLRVLGPEPWRVAYVEPSIRPDDGRYGENPNRLQQHYQYQVILKPDPGDPQELYLQSLEALGIRAREHDIRFVEDNWESPALGAWGLGWEVWLDGQEITQFTYFQQAGGITLDPVSVELTYGLERIAIALQRIQGFREIQWSDGITYGDVNLQAEQEHSKYYFEIADVERMRQLFSLYEAEVESALRAGLVLPAYDYVLRCSHTFNVLDTRGAIGVTERAGLFGRMRDLSRRVAEAYLAQRQRLEYPFLKDEGRSARRKDETEVESRRSEAGRGFRPLTSDFIPRSDPSSFILEIGTEELPSADVDSALGQLNELVPALLEENRLGYRSFSVLGTPRRLAVRVEGLDAAQPDREAVVKGPPAARAFDAEGRPTQAAIGFARGKGVPVESLEKRSMDGGEYAVAVVHEKGRPTGQVLSEKLPGLIAAIKFDKSMRWNASGVSFSRPIRWIVALLGDRVVPFQYAGLASGRVTRGLRPMGSPEVEIARAADYEETVRGQGIVLDPAERARQIAESVDREAAAVRGEAHYGPELLAEVKNLVERPTAIRGEFNEEFLSLPREVLESVMKKHQRYFPVVKAASPRPAGASRGPGVREDSPFLLPHFITIRNGDTEHVDLVREGNEHVLRARFADANYFVREDLKQPLEAYLPRLRGLTFQVKLGSMLDKSERIERLVAAIAPMLGLSDAERTTAVRAAHLAKADLATQMVVEMTSLQGVMGRHYALRSGESPEVARAIEEQYAANGSIGLPGAAVGLADRLDSLVGLFAAGLAPTGAKDPFALRRAALGIVGVLIEKDLGFDLREAMRAAAALLPIPAGEAVLAQGLEFVTGRLRGLLIDSGFRYDVVDAVLAQRAHNPAAARRAAAELAEWVARPDWPQTLAAYARCVRITREFKETFDLHPEALIEPSEKALYEAYRSVARAVESARTVDEFFAAFTPIIPVVSKFFEDVLVMHEDPDVRQNRLGLLQRIAALTQGIADLSKLEGF